MIGPVVRRVSSSIFVGRVVERARLEAALEAAEQGEPGLVLIGGEAGIGKSRLAAELVSIANARGAMVARGLCLETKAATLPFGPWVEILEELIRRDPSTGDARTDEPTTAAFARLVPEFEPPERSDARLPSGDDRLRLFHAVLALVRQTAEDHVLHLVIEDVHWADASSLDLLRFVAAQLSAERLLMLATFRSDELHVGDQLPSALGELVRLPHVARIDMAPFTEAEVADQLTGIGGRRPDDEVVRRIFARSDGNPFVVEELAGGAPDGTLPPTLSDVLAHRLATLSPETRRVVLAASAVGREVGHDLLARISAVPKERLVDALREAVERHVLVRAGPRGDSFAFRHALIEEFAYGALLSPERDAIHGEIVTALQDVDGSSAEIARHAILAGDLRLGLASAVDAADQARETLAFAEALAHAQQALRLWSEVEDAEGVAARDEPSLLVFAARCAVAVGDWSQAATLGRWALGLLDHDRRDERVALLLDLADWHQYSDDGVAHADALRDAAELVPANPPSAQRARVLTELVIKATWEGNIDEARQLAQEAVEVARTIGVRTEEVRALTALALTFTSSLQFDTAVQILSEAEQIVATGKVTEEYVVATLVFRRCELALLTGDFENAIALTEAGLARAARAGTIDQQRPFLRWHKIAALGSLGRWREAEALMNEVEHDSTTMQARQSIQLFVEVLVRQGRVADAASAVQKTDFGYETPFEGSWILQTRIRVANGGGRWDDAGAAADQAIALYEGKDESDLVFLLEDSVRGEADRADAARGRRRRAEEADARHVGLERLQRLRRIAQAAIAGGGAGRLIEAVLATAEAEGSRLRRLSDAALWDEAASRREALRQPWETAYARLRQAEAILSQGGDRPEALRLLRAAHRIAAELGARPLVEQIESLGRRARLRLESMPRKHATRRATTPDGVLVALTTRESEVLSLVAAGHTNREIGEALFISEKTASVHITNAMDKLGALSRYEAAASATRLGLIEASHDGNTARP
jgi:DNA-binding NarL/FixJ family response regulator